MKTQQPPTSPAVRSAAGSPGLESRPHDPVDQELEEQESEARTANPYTPADLAAIAQAAAAEVQGEAVRWWRDERDPYLLHTEAKFTLPNAKPITVLLVTILSP